MDIEKELNAIIEAKKGNQEIALFYDGAGEWNLSVGNPTSCVMLGEVNGEIETYGDSPKDVILKMKTILEI
jgi:hypothetical protein